MIVELGCGDGRGALALATAAEPGTLVLAADPVAAAMNESSRRAAKSLPDVVFLEASAERLAAVVPGAADRLVTWFPWGSLLRGVLGADAPVGDALAALLKPGGCLSAIVSVTPRDGGVGLPELSPANLHGLRPSPSFELVAACPSSREDVLATRSTWGRRLLGGGSGANRAVWRLEWRRGRRGEG